jgi:hypothetical protein
LVVPFWCRPGFASPNDGKSLSLAPTAWGATHSNGRCPVTPSAPRHLHEPARLLAGALRRDCAHCSSCVTRGASVPNASVLPITDEAARQFFSASLSNRCPPALVILPPGTVHIKPLLIGGADPRLFMNPASSFHLAHQGSIHCAPVPCAALNRLRAE